MIEWKMFSPAHNIDPRGDSCSVEYTTTGERDFLQIDEQIEAMFYGYA
jgi:hypothetical protein